MTKMIEQPQQWWQADADPASAGQPGSSEVAQPVGPAADSGDSAPEAKAKEWGEITSMMEADIDTPDRTSPVPESAPKPKEAETTAATTPVEVPPVVTPKPAEVTPTPVPAPTPQVAEAPAPTPAPQTAPPTTPAAQPQTSTADWQKMQADYERSLEPLYKLDEADVSKWVISPNEVVPKLAARLHSTILQQVTANVTQALLNQLPPVIESTLERKNTSAKAEEGFFTKWPELKEHRKTVMEIGKLYRAQNPQASLDDFIRQVGTAAWVSAQLPAVGLAQRLQPTPTAVPNPQPAPLAGYQPAAPASRAAPTAPVVEKNIWGDFAQEMKEEFF